MAEVELERRLAERTVERDGIARDEALVELARTSAELEYRLAERTIERDDVARDEALAELARTNMELERRLAERTIERDDVARDEALAELERTNTELKERLAERTIERDDAARDDALAELGRTNEELERRLAERTIERDDVARDEALAESKRAEALQRTIVEALPSAMVMADGAGRISLLNAEAERLFGYERNELLGESIERLIPGRFRDGHPSLRGGFMMAPSVRAMGASRELFGLRKDGTEMPIEIGLSPINTHDGFFVLAAIIDITERKRAEQQRLDRVQLHNEQLEVLNQELESFSYSVSHDLRTPVRAISGYARAVLEDHGVQLDDEGRRLLSVVVDEAKRMGELIDDLLEFSRLGRAALAAAQIDMTSLVNEVFVEQNAAVSNSKAELRLDAPLPVAWGDRILLRQVLANLISNAIKYSQKNVAPCINVRGTVEGHETVYHIEDNGVGFDMTYADKLFGVFQRLHHADEFPGLGIGLAIVQRVVARHGGRVWAEGRLGHGATFSFALPTGDPI